MSWHIDAAALRRYLADELDLPSSMAIEAHVGGCEACRALVPRDQDWLDRSWLAVVDEVVGPRHGPMERLAVSAGIGAPMARLLAATPASHRSWWAAVVAVLAFAVAAAHLAGGDPTALWSFLTVAPLLPVVGVAVAYGPPVDPLYELVVSAPVSGLRLLLIRAFVVLAATVAMTALAIPLLPNASWTAVAWLLPALALTTVTLALASWHTPATAGGGVTAAWVSVVAVTSLTGNDALAAFRASAQLWFAAVLLIAVLLLVLRRRSFDVVVSR